VANKPKKPVDCDRCQSELEEMPLAKAEVAHIRQHLGQRQAAVYINGLLGEYHRNHR
jgi:hypothetical protein